MNIWECGAQCTRYRFYGGNGGPPPLYIVIHTAESTWCVDFRIENSRLRDFDKKRFRDFFSHPEIARLFIIMIIKLRIFDSYFSRKLWTNLTPITTTTIAKNFGLFGVPDRLIGSKKSSTVYGQTTDEKTGRYTKWIIFF